MSAKATKQWLTVLNKSDESADMIISGPIGKSWWDDTGTSAKEFRDEFDKIPKGKTINVRINSEGGSIKDGLEIYNTLRGARRGDVTCFVDGYAVSIASIIALGGSRTVSPKSSIWMIHEPWSYTQGNAEDHLRSAEMLDKHGDMLAAIYAEETGKGKAAMRDAMRAETWLTGEEATAYGLADETPEEDVKEPMAALDISKFQNVPERIKTILAAASPVDPSHKQPRSETGQSALPQRGPAAANSPALSGVGTANTKQKEKIMEPNTEAAVSPTADSRIIALEAQLQSERKARITQTVNGYVDRQQITKDEVEFYVNCAMGNEPTTFAALDKRTATKTGGDPVGHSITIVAENPLDEIRKKHTTPLARAEAMKNDWKALYDDALLRDARRGLTPMAANTYSATLVTSFLIDGSITNLQNRWAMLKAFSIDFNTDPYKPLATGVLKQVTAGSATQTNATNFESGNSTVAPVSITMAQYTQSFQVSNSDLNSGLRMQDLVTINTANFANKIIEVATVPMTTAIFTGGSEVSSAAAFGFSNLANLQALLKKSSIKNLILDGSYIARIANSPGFFQAAGVVGGNTGAWQAFGWDMIAQNTDWTGAGANVQGFACNPQAIAGVVGLPLTPPNIPGGILSQSSFVVPQVNTPVAIYNWFNPSTRIMWTSYDIMAGFQQADTTAGFVITSQ